MKFKRPVSWQCSRSPSRPPACKPLDKETGKPVEGEEESAVGCLTRRHEDRAREQLATIVAKRETDEVATCTRLRSC